jgi:hypothetical protein
MKTSTGRKNSYKDPVFYVVTRSGRRAWYKDYWTLAEAQKHVDGIVTALRRADDPGHRRVVIVETTDPEKIT